MNFLRLKHFLELNKGFWKKKNTQADTWQHQRVPRALLTSAQGPPNADVIMAFDDVIVDLVNVDQVNGQTGSTSRWGPRVSRTESLTGGSRVSGPGKRKRKREAKAVLGSKVDLAGSTTHLLSSVHGFMG